MKSFVFYQIVSVDSKVVRRTTSEDDPDNGHEVLDREGSNEDEM
jgi:hypothetical protein